MQDKGSASQTPLTVCLHIVFVRDWVSQARDGWHRSGRIPPFVTSNRETLAHLHRCLSKVVKDEHSGPGAGRTALPISRMDRCPQPGDRGVGGRASWAALRILSWH